MWIKRLKREWFTLLVCGVLVILLVYVFIKHPSNPVYVYPPLSFRVDETLLGASVEDATLKMRMSMPAWWARLEAVGFSNIFDNVAKRFSQVHERGSLLSIYWDPRVGAVCVVSVDDRLSLDLFLSSWSEVLAEMYGSSEVLRTTFSIAGIPFHQFMVSTRDVVHIKLICAHTKRSIFAVDYLVPKAVYAKVLRSIESSIGSIQVVNND